MKNNRLAQHISKFIIFTSLLFTLVSLHSQTLIVGNKADAKISFIDIDKNRIVKELQTGVGPHEIAVSPDQKYAVVVNYGDRTKRGDSISLIDIEKRTVIKEIQHEHFRSPHGIQWFKDNKHVLLTAENKNAIVKVNPFSGKIINVADTKARGSHMLVISPDEKLAAVANLFNSNVSIIDLSSYKTIKIIETGKGAEGIDFAPDGKTLWVSNREDDTVSVIDTESLEIIVNLDSKGFPIRVKVSPDGRYAVVSNATGNSISVFDAKRLELVKTITTNEPDGHILEFPIGVLIDNQSKTAYIAHTQSAKISMYDLEKLEFKGVLDAGPVPDGMGIID